MPTERARQIREAQRRAARDVERLILEAERALEAMYRGALTEIQADLAGLADSEGRIPLDALPRAEAVIRARLERLGVERDGLLDARLGRVVSIGVNPWGVAIPDGVDPGGLGEEVLQFVRTFRDANGLQLSDRLWRVDRAARERMTEAVESAVIQGQSASQAARELLTRGQPVPEDLFTKAGMARIREIDGDLADALLTGRGSPMNNAERVMRTELNRAWGEAGVRAAAQHPDVIGVKFVLSPLHPEFDVCDLHANANLHGLGPGVYPVDDHPWPAHPNTFSYLEPVFGDEVSDDDRAGRQSRNDYIAGKSARQQDRILGGQAKGWAFRRGHIDSRSLETPWKNILPRLRRQHIDIPEEFLP